MIKVPETVDGKPLTGQIASYNTSGLLAIIICPKGDRIGIYSPYYTLGNYGIIRGGPFGLPCPIQCPTCGWIADSIQIDNSPVGATADDDGSSGP